MTEVTRQLTEICGPGFARFAGAADLVAGAPARWVAAPGGVRAAARVLRLATERGLAVVPRGAGTKIDWGAVPSRLDIMLDTGRLAGIRYEAERELVEVGAGTPLRAVQTVLGREGRRLALDAPSPGATVGGVVVADEPGPLRHRHGTPCEQLFGLSYLDAAGDLVRVDGVDLEAARLLCGSQGGLGLLVSTTLRVQPKPTGQAWVVCPVWTPLEMHDLVRSVLDTPIRPAAIEVDLPAARPAVRRAGWHGSSAAAGVRGTDGLTSHAGRPAGQAGSGVLAFLVEGDVTEVVERADRLVRLLGAEATVSPEPPGWWRRYPFQPGDIALRLDVPVTDLHAAVYALRDAAGGPVSVRGSAGLGSVYAALPGAMSPDRVAEVLTGLRGVLLARRGRCVVLTAPPKVRRGVDLWGGLPTLPRLRAAKERVDPGHRLAPGRLPGGL